MFQKFTLTNIILLALWTFVQAGIPISPWINELHYDNAGIDADESVEIAGVSGTDLSTYEVLFYNGSNGTVYGTLPLSGLIDDEGNGYGAVCFPFQGIQNGGPDGVALHNLSDSSVVDLISYEGSFTPISGPAAGMLAADIGVEESSQFNLGFSLQKTGTGLTGPDFAWAGPVRETCGMINSGQSFGGALVPVVGFGLVSSSVIEGDAGSAMYTVSFSLSAAPEEPLLIGVDLDTSGTADSIDFTFTPQVYQLDSNSALSQTVNITINGDTAIEFDESVVLRLIVVAGNAIEGQNTHSLVIRNDDVPNFGCPDVFINEIHYDNFGADTLEGVEIAGPAGHDLSCYQLYLYTGNSRTIYDTVDLFGLIDDEGAGFGAVWFPVPGIQNGPPDAILFYNNCTNEIVQFISYEGSFFGAEGPAFDIPSADIGVEQFAVNYTQTLQLVNNGLCGTEFSWAGPRDASRGTINDGQNFTNDPVCPQVGGLSVTGITQNRADLNWNCAIGGGSYIIRGNIVGRSGFIELNVGGQCQSPFRVQGLQPNTSYFWQVKAFCGPGGTESQWSAIDTFTTSCATPANLSTTNLTSNSVRLSWNNVPGSSGFNIRGRRVGTTSWTNANSGGTSLNSGAILSPSTSYEWQVRAVCSDGGTSPWSPLSQFTTASIKKAISTEQNGSLSVTPNPASSTVNIRLESGNHEADVLTKIFDLSGKLVFESRINRLISEDFLTIDVSTFQEGVYQLIVNDGINLYTEKLVIVN